jgi:SAM-dependent methyltransferase
MEPGSNYDNYAKLWSQKKDSSTHYAHQYLEKPAMQKKIPNISGQTILIIGCGSGEEVLQFLGLGAKKVIGIDNSKELIQIAKEKLEIENISATKYELICQDIQKHVFSNLSFDFIYSSLTLHYIQDWNLLFDKIYLWLKPSCKMLFSVHHPIKWGSQSTRSKDCNSFVLGYKKYKNKQSDFEVFGDYLTPRAIEDTLFGSLKIVHYHKPIGLILQILRQSKLGLLDFVEPLPTLESDQIKPDFFAVYSKIPLFLILELEK